MGVLTRLPGIVLGALPGAALGVTALVAGLARRDKALHPIGRVGTGRLVVTEPMTGPMAERIAELGIEALAHSGSQPCTVRWSRSMGLPERWPDIEGMALRLPSAGSDGGAADVLFASTGAHGPFRYLLLLRGAGRFGHQTSLLPVRARGRAGTFMLAPAAEPVGGLPPAKRQGRCSPRSVEQAGDAALLLTELRIQRQHNASERRRGPLQPSELLPRLLGCLRIARMTVLAGRPAEPLAIHVRSGRGCNRSGRQRSLGRHGDRRRPVGHHAVPVVSEDRDPAQQVQPIAAPCTGPQRSCSVSGRRAAGLSPTAPINDPPNHAAFVTTCVARTVVLMRPMGSNLGSSW